jgi:hypothetical protein
VAGSLVSDKEKVGSSKSNAAQGGFRDVVVGRDGGKPQEAAELAKIPEQVSNSPCRAGTWLEGMTMSTAPAKQASEERSGTSSSQLEMRVCAEDSSRSRLVFDPIDLPDEVQSFVCLGMLVLLETASA